MAVAESSKSCALVSGSLDLHRLSRLLLLAFLALGSPAASEPGRAIDPAGVYFHAWTGSTAGTEWAFVFETEPGHYRLSDVFGNGFAFTLDSDGQMTVEDEGQGGSGRGRFLNTDEARFDWQNWGMSFSSTMQRAPHTEAGIPLSPQPQLLDGEGWAGVWRASESTVSPTTGAILETREIGEVRTKVDRGTLRIRFPDETVDVALLAKDDLAILRAFRSALPGSKHPTPKGCSTTRPLDTYGILKRLGDDTIQYDLWMQTIGKVGTQVQKQVRYVLHRSE